MKDHIIDLVYLSVIIATFVLCYKRCSSLSHRIDMVIMVQESQQKYIDKLMENK